MLRTGFMLICVVTCLKSVCLGIGTCIGPKNVGNIGKYWQYRQRAILCRQSPIHRNRNLQT